MSGSPEFLFGTGKELNQMADDATTPFCIFLYALQPVKLKQTISGGIEESFSVYMEFLKVTEFGEYTNDVEDEREQCLEILKEFLVRLQQYRVNGSKVYLVEIRDEAKSVNFYDKYDVNMVGHSLEFNLKKLYRDNICLT